MSFERCSPVLLAVALVLTVSGTACRREAGTNAGAGGTSRASGPARFAVPSNSPTAAGTVETRPLEAEPLRLTNQFCVLQSELSPAVVVHSETPHLTLFSGLTNAGLSAPKFVAWATRNGPRSFQRDETLDVSVMAENWVLVWWAGAEGWTNWDCPWVVYLQHKPDTMSLDADGLHMNFPKRAGDVVMMPLYGYQKLPLEGRDFRAEHQLPKLKVPIKTWEWAKVIPRDPLTRLRYWGAALREFPVRVEESIRMGGDGMLTVRSRFQHLPVGNDWRGRQIKVAPVSPVWALVAKVGGFPIRFSERWFDLEMPTPFGPVFGIEDVDTYEVSLPVLRYVEDGVEAGGLVERLRVHLKGDDSGEAERTVARFEASLRRGVVDWSSLPGALPLAFALGRTNEIATLRGLVEKLATGGGLSSGGVGPTPEGLWAYVNFTGDAAVVKSFWPAIKANCSNLVATGWRMIGNAGTSSLAASAGQTLAITRLARLAGDGEIYRNGCVALARELAGLFIQERGSEYFYQHQPWHGMESFPKHGAWLALSDADGGWELGGRDGVPGRNSGRRWLGSDDPDIARFVRDAGFGSSALRGGSDASLIWKAMFSAGGGSTNGSSGGMASGQMMPTVRLFPPGASESFRLTSELGVPKSGMTLVVSARTGGGATSAWPQLTWPQWRTPAGAPWTFGEIRPSQQRPPKSARVSAFKGGNSQILEYDLSR